MKKIILIFTLVLISLNYLTAAIPPEVNIIRNGILTFEALGQMDCPLYLEDNYTGTIVYEWVKKVRKFGEESPDSKPFRSARCEYKAGRLSMYYPSDRKYVYRFFWDGNLLSKIETYNSEGEDVSRRSYNYSWPNEGSRPGQTLVYIERNSYFEGRKECYYEFGKGKQFPMTIHTCYYDKKGGYRSGSHAFLGWIQQDGRIHLRDHTDVYSGWNLLQSSAKVSSVGREDGPRYFYGDPVPSSSFYLYIYK